MGKVRKAAFFILLSLHFFFVRILDGVDVKCHL
jgi:hypothetical protein